MFDNSLKNKVAIFYFKTKFFYDYSKQNKQNQVFGKH